MLSFKLWEWRNWILYDLYSIIMIFFKRNIEGKHKHLYELKSDKVRTIILLVIIDVISFIKNSFDQNIPLSILNF